MGAGLVAPEKSAKDLINALDQVIENGIKQDITENGKENIIIRELANHEAYYTGDIESTEDAKSYNFTREDILTIFNQERIKQNENN